VEQTITALPGRNDKTASTIRAFRDSTAVLGRSLREAIHERNRFALTTRARALREQQFVSTLKSVIKDVSADTVDAIGDRKARQEARVQLYSDMMQLVTELTDEHARMLARSRKASAWGIAGIVIGLGVAALNAYQLLQP
jgi:hypothetical protein